MYNYDSFDQFINSTLGRTIGQGECWDYINLIWSHLGFKYWTYPPSDPSATNHGVKWGVINVDARNANIIDKIIFISNINDVKRGDIVVTSGGDYGHAGFINEDYTTNKNYPIYSQNYNNRRSVGLDSYSLNDFVGAFRYTDWNETPPTPPTIITNSTHFPWVLYARKLRNNRGV